MKTFYSFLYFILISACVFGQQSNPFSILDYTTLNSNKLKPLQIKKTLKYGVRSISQPANIDCTDPSYLFCEDFEGPTSPALPTGFSTSTLETYYYVTVNGTETQVNGFYTGNSEDANEGGYWPVDEFTQFAMTNDDACKPNQSVPNTNNNCDLSFEVLNLPVVNMSNSEDLFLKFDYYHDMNYGGGSAKVDYKIGSAGSWSDLSYSLIDADAWQEGIFSLSQLNNTDSVFLRFVWTDSSSWASGFAVDNITINNLDSNDISIQTINQFSLISTGSSTYSQVPLSQVGNGFWFRSIIRNVGTNQQDSLRLKVSVTPSGFNTESWAVNLPSLERDTFITNTEFIPTATGNYQFDFTAESDSSTETNSSNLDVDITEFIYARDSGQEDVGLSSFSVSGDVVTVEHGCSYDIQETTSLYAVDVYISQFCQPNAYLKAKLYQVDNSTNSPTASYLSESNFLSVQSTDAWQSIKFPQPITLNAGTEYLVTICGDGQLTDTLFVGGSSAISGSYGWRIYNGYIPSGETQALADGTYQTVPMVRMNFNPDVQGPIGISEENEIEFSIFPNPNNGIFTITTNSNIQQTLEIQNMLGQIVHTDKINGQKQITLSHLKKGVYTVSISNDNAVRSVKKISIQ